MNTGRRGRSTRHVLLAGTAALCAGSAAACAATQRAAPQAPAPAVTPDAAPAAAAPTRDTSLLVVPAAVAAPTRRDTTPAPPQPLALDTAPPPLDPTDASGRVRWVGREADRTLSADDRTLLRRVFGIDDVRRIYLPVAAGDVLRYAAHAPGCPDAGRPTTRGGACRVVGVRIGLAAPRDTGETWDAFTARVEHGGSRAWSAVGGRSAYAGLDALDPDARPAFERLVADARAAGFPIHVRETYRTPERQAAILARNDGRTTTLTSAHSYGRAVDISVGGRRRTWVEFRRWVLTQQNGAFRLIGTPENTWDWPHIEYVGAADGPPLGYRTVDALVAAARACRAEAASDAEAAARCTRASPRPAEGVAVTTVADEAPARSRSARGSRRGGRHGRRESARSARSRGGKRSHAGSSHTGSTRGGGSHRQSHTSKHRKSR